MIDLKTLWIFAIGVFLSALFFIEEALTSEEEKEVNIWKLVILVIINSILGGFIMVTVFYLLEQYYPLWNMWIKVGLAGGVATMGKDGIKMFHKYIKVKGNTNA
ncbi:hypothetical protein CPG37_04645 [Malaciobacter canalis]|uniref:Uncharacterized protein n=1 Tax=Malaciobacter canalis TaxID=1912871 RepID=A0ABX4LVT5_9BACT|nr:hypothetical protein [Malaciobacter canalis]PHO10341.1 hypothetical protein CPG37_04645 [Malaciobacter canalis]QEE32445.1 putative membrane protein [Malaciobacter canalis]